MKRKFRREIYLLSLQYLPWCVSLHLQYLLLFRNHELLKCWSRISYIQVNLRNVTMDFCFLWHGKQPWLSVIKCSKHVVHNSITRRPPTVFIVYTCSKWKKEKFSVMDRKLRTRTKYTRSSGHNYCFSFTSIPQMYVTMCFHHSYVSVCM